MLFSGTTKQYHFPSGAAPHKLPRPLSMPCLSTVASSIVVSTVNGRFKQARNNAIQDGLVEMGRRQTHDGAYVAVALGGGVSTRGGKLSPELYFRLLPLEQSLATGNQSTTESPSPNSPPSKFLYMNNLPKVTTATQLSAYLETLDCQAQRIELVESRFKSSVAVAAHVECVDTEDALRIVQTAQHRGLVCCGRSIYATFDRITPDQVTRMGATASNPDMSYTREENSGVASAAEVESMVNSLLSDDATSGTEQQPYKLIDNTNHIMRQDCNTRDTKDHFEDLIAWK